jgi:hypothetical protein
MKQWLSNEINSIAQGENFLFNQSRLTLQVICMG